MEGSRGRGGFSSFFRLRRCRDTNCVALPPICVCVCLCAISLGRICPFQSLPFLFAFAHSGIRCVTVFGRCDSNFRSRCPSILVLSCAIPFNCAGGVVHLGCVRQHGRGSMALGMLFHSGFNSCLAGEIFHGVLRFFLLR